jgi:thioredoxin 1
MKFLTEKNFEQETKSGKVLLQFTASWCGPCKALSPIVEALEFTKFKVDVDDAPELLKKFNVRSVPTLVLLNDGKEIKRKVGLLKKEELESFVNE